MRTVALVASILNFGLIVAGYFGLWRRPEGIPLAMHVVSVLSTALNISIMILLAQSKSPLWAYWAGTAIYLLSIVIFLWSAYAIRRQRLSIAFSEDKPEFLIQHGPFRYIRHPFYLSYSLCWIAGGVATLNPILPPFIALMIVIHGITAWREERKFEGTPLADDYAEYRRRAGMFWPKLPG